MTLIYPFNYKIKDGRTYGGASSLRFFSGLVVGFLVALLELVVLIIGEGFQDLVDLERLGLWFILVVGMLGVLGASWIQKDLKLFNHIQNKRGIDLDLLGIHHVRVILFEYFQLNFLVCFEALCQDEHFDIFETML